MPGEGPYFSTAEPLPPDGTQAQDFGYSRGVSLEPGAEVTIPVALRSDAPIGEWQLSAEELPNPHLLPDVYNELSFSWDEASGKAGDVRYLTIKRAPPPDGGTPVFLRVAIQSTLGSVVHTNWLVVGTDETVPGDLQTSRWTGSRRLVSFVRYRRDRVVGVGQRMTGVRLPRPPSARLVSKEHTSLLFLKTPAT